MSNREAPFLFVIDTADYAGNFERELCAYITGRVGECGVGRNMVEQFKEAGFKPFENVIEEGDENGCHRPVSIYPTPGYFNDGAGGSYQLGPDGNAPQEAFDDYRESCRSIYGSYMEAPKRHLVTLASGTDAEKAELARLGWSVQACHDAIAYHQSHIDKAEKCDALAKFPSFQSVAISFETRPTPEQISLMKGLTVEFAEKLCHYSQEPRISRILGFRLIEQETVRKSREAAL